MGKVIEKERDIMLKIAESGENGPVLMLNQNRYKQGEYPNGDLYKKWRLVNKTMIDSVDGKIIWTLPVKGQVLINGHLEPLDEMLAYWYPSHGAFLDMIKSASVDSKRNLRLVAELTQRADHPVNPLIPETSYLKGFSFEILPSW